MRLCAIFRNLATEFNHQKESAICTMLDDRIHHTMRNAYISTPDIDAVFVQPHQVPPQARTAPSASVLLPRTRKGTLASSSIESNASSLALNQRSICIRQSSTKIPSNSGK